MGVDYTATAVIGVRVSPEKLVKRTSVRGCRHPLPNPDVKFCPECGRPAYVDDSEYPDEIAGYRIVWGTDYQEAVVAYFQTSASDGQESFVALGRVPEVGLDDMRDRLAPLGLWDEAAFGLHAILAFSY